MRHRMMAPIAVALALTSAGVLHPTGMVAAFAQQAAPAQNADTVFTLAQIEALVKPIALYPDPLLAQLLPASAYPLDIVQAARWIERNRALVEKTDFTAVDAMTWDASVKALIRFPDVIKQMNDNLDWTSDLGDAFVNQPADLATVIQDLRAKAAKGGALATTSQQTVVFKTEGPGEVIYIEPAEPEVIYVPRYDPDVVYEPVGSVLPATLLTFGTAIAVGAMVYNNPWNWRTGAVYPPRWPGYPGYRPGYPGAPGRGNVNIGNDINIGSGNSIGNTKPWQPDPARYRPGQGSKPGLARAGGAGRIDRPGPVGGVDGPAGPGGAGGIGGALGGAAAGAIGGAALGSVGQRPARPDARPGPDRPKAGAGAARPSKPARPPTAQARPAVPKAAKPRPMPSSAAFDRVGAAAYGNRGAAGRVQMSNPVSRGGGAAISRGGGGARMGGGGGGRGGRR